MTGDGPALADELLRSRSEIASVLGSAYGLAGLVLNEAVHKPVQGVRLRLSDAGGGRYLAKGRPDVLTVAEFDHLIELQWAVRDRGAPVCVPLRTSAGTGWVRLAGRELHLQRLLPGPGPDLAADGSARFGAALGRFAVAAGEVAARTVGDWSFPHQRGRWVPDQPAALCASTRFFAGVPAVEAADLAVIEAVAQDAWRRCPVGSLPAGYVHGDVSPLNCVLTAGDGAVLVDLDELRWAHPLFDLLQGVVTVGAVDLGPGSSAVRARWATDRVSAYLAAYAEHRALTAAERAVAGPYLQLVLLRIVAGELDLDDPGYPTPPDVGSQVSRLAALLRQPPPFAM